jgi:hypothetical protein
VAYSPETDTLPKKNAHRNSERPVERSILLCVSCTAFILAGGASKPVSINKDTIKKDSVRTPPRIERSPI